jgi:chemotaxis protein MotA
MNFLFGLTLAIVGFIAASMHLKQDIMSYYDFVAFAVVVAGTCSVLIITRPKKSLRYIFKNIMKSIFGFKRNKVNFAKKCFDCVANKTFTDPDHKKIEDKIIIDGLEMIELGFSKEKIEDALSDRYLNHKKAIGTIAAWFKRCAKYPPAFGLGGTVLGLIHLMKGISAGADPKETGIRMAIALVATFYGLILSNLILNPLSEAIAEKVKSDEDLVEIAIKTILMMKDDQNLIECQEGLNSYLVDENEKINFMNNLKNEEEEAAAAA